MPISWTKLKNPLVTLVILQYYETSSGITLFTSMISHMLLPEHSVHFTLDFIPDLVFCTKYQHHISAFWALLVSAYKILSNFPN